ncbi:uncharacterized protein LOC127714211 [Mytilus californianus]|uniref:uncharacterized protein LOC127714211 n=1 Tax=Mytilus californianus TaxID=6549 RepID=UPI0022453236|nr:uncharacterized protein LOC127714211 [Mytilus californianus]
MTSCACPQGESSITFSETFDEETLYITETNETISMTIDIRVHMVARMDEQRRNSRLFEISSSCKGTCPFKPGQRTCKQCCKENGLLTGFCVKRWCVCFLG